MKNVLIIAYFFPPMGGAGVQKSLKFVKYLHEFNYQPIVLTVNSKYTRWMKDYTAISDIPSDTVVYRTPTIDLNWIFKVLWGLRLHKVVSWLQLNWLLPDAEITWLPFARYGLSKILSKYKIDIVYISGGPFSSMLLGPYLARKYKLKFVVDFRDEWTNNPTRLDWAYPQSSIARENKYEKSVLEHSSGVVYTHPLYMKDNFEKKYPFLLDKRTEVITNGFDDDDFNDIRKNTSQNSKILSIVYTGSFYDRRQPAILWKALSELINDGIIDSGKVSVEIIGKNTKSFVLGQYQTEKSIKQVAKFTPNQSRPDVLAASVNATMLLLYIAPGLNCNAELPGKLYDYIRSYKPILAIIPPRGAAAEILQNSRTAFIYDSSNLSAVKNGITEVYNLWCNGQLSVNPDKEYINRYNRNALTQKLSILFDKVLEK